MRERKTIGFLLSFKTDEPPGDSLARSVARVLKDRLTVDEVDVECLGVVEELDSEA
jgi:hypothetical protein